MARRRFQRARRAVRYVVRRARALSPFDRLMAPIDKMAARPSKPIAAALTVGGLLYLLFNPTSSGDSWLQRVIWGIEGTKQGQTLSAAWVGSDGQTFASVAGTQIVGNVWGALPAFGLAAAIRWAGRKFGF